MSDLSLFQTTRENLSFLKDQWLGLVGQYGGIDAAKERWFISLSERYSERSRFYHNLHHIAEMLRFLHSFVGAQDMKAVLVATWFHDAVYDTRKSDNEERSADLASQALAELGARAETVAEVQQLILATKKHEDEGLRPSARIFLDADLSILGTGEEVYLQYSEAIRREYAWVEDSLYRRERKWILEGFLRRERIYFTDEICKRFEAQARRNIGGEIQRIEALS